MTQEQFKKAIDDRKSQITNLEKEIADLKNTYIKEHAKFDIGEMVLVTERPYSGVGKTHVAFVSDIQVVGIDIKYSFHKSKKDGSPSSFKLHTWGRRPEVKKLTNEPNDEPSVATGDAILTDDAKNK